MGDVARRANALPIRNSGKRPQFLAGIFEISIQIHTVDLRSCKTKEVIKKVLIVHFLLCSCYVHLGEIFSKDEHPFSCLNTHPLCASTEIEQANTSSEAEKTELYSGRSLITPSLSIGTWDTTISSTKKIGIPKTEQFFVCSWYFCHFPANVGYPPSAPNRRPLPCFATCRDNLEGELLWR